MRYKQSLKIGPSEGTIQCTYAIIYADADGKEKVFSLQRQNFNAFNAERLSKDNAAYYEQGRNFDSFVVYNRAGGSGLVGWNTNNRFGVETGYITFDMPLVEAEDYSEDRLVPVRLLYPALVFIKESFASRRIMTYDEYVMHKYSDLLGTKSKEEIYKIAEGDKAPEEYRDHPELYDRWYRLSKKLSTDTIYYVKPAAFRWMPVSQFDIENDPRVLAARKKVEDAKKILFAIGATNIL